MNVKQAIIIRRDLKMRRGKEIAQGSHASMAFLTKRITTSTNHAILTLSEAEKEWLNSGTKKIVLQAPTETDLIDLQDHAKQLGLETNLIVDHGLTEFNGVPTITALAIGPGPEGAINLVTAALTLY